MDIQITCNHSIINKERKGNLVNKMKTLHRIHLEFILHYIILTTYYIVNGHSDYM